MPSPTSNKNFPIYQVSPQGNVTQIAQLLPNAQGGYQIQSECEPFPFWLAGENAQGHFYDLPYFLDDLRPQGFLGRRIARQLAQIDERYSSDPRHWTTQHILLYLLQHGADLSGNLLLGETAWQQYQAFPRLQPITASDYPAQAKAVLKGSRVGSSAAGEQAKFTAFTEQGHAIIKFSRLDTVAGQRWADLLIAEHLALQYLACLGIATANTQLHYIDNAIFLQSIRFDRHGAHGRSPLLSGTAVDAEFVGAGMTWLDSASGLQVHALITETDYQAVLTAYCFGRWIGNTDMHLGNISWIPETTQFRLAPIYDMTSMLYAPLEHNLPLPQLPHPLRTPIESDLPQVKETAQQFWQQLAERQDISSEFKTICHDILKRWPN